ncbi:DNA adenine methylase [Sulfurimonas sp. SAG-AH-194-I05]|nr:hypothetical protein [Sulfurimonas sp. SAG-AH-194-I05]MDF1875928.1 DNA adenine methylase [Sulfurimonas sp. SAG-AH-194-I05]
MAVFTNTGTQDIELTKAENGLDVMETENSEQSELHEKDIVAAAMLKKFGLKFADISDKHRYFKAYNTQLTNNGFNYPGGKYELASIVKQLIPSDINNFYDVCAGAGTMGINISAKKIIHNEYDEYLFDLVKKLSTGTAEYNYEKLLETEKKYELDGLITKKDMMITILKKFQWSSEPKHLNLTDYQNFSKTFCMKCFNRFKKRFESLREDFNNSKNKPWYMYLLMLVFSFDHTARYDTKGNFNNTFNDRKFSKSLRAKLLLFSKKLIENKDRYSFRSQSYVDLLKNIVFAENDFFYFDPPYYITSNEYTRRYWGKEIEIDFLQHLKVLNDEKVKFGLSNVIFHKGKVNTMLIDFINDNKLYVHYLPKSYDGTAKTKSKKPTVEVFVTNYPTHACPKFLKVPMEYDKSKCSTALIQELKYSSDFIQGRLVDFKDEELFGTTNFQAAETAKVKAYEHKEIAKKSTLEEITHRKQAAYSYKVTKAKNKGVKGAYGEALKRMGVSKNTAQLHLQLINDKRVMALKDSELLKIPNLTYTKLLNMTKLNDDDFKSVVNKDTTILPRIAKEKAFQTKDNKDKANEVVENETMVVETKIIDSSESVEREVISKVDCFVKPAYNTLSDERNKEIESLDIDEARKQLTMLESAGWLILNNTTHAQNNIFPFNRVS